MSDRTEEFAREVTAAIGLPAAGEPQSELVLLACSECGGRGFIDPHTPCSDQPELTFYYGCCEFCDRQTGICASIEHAVEEWNAMQQANKSASVRANKSVSLAADAGGRVG